MVGGDVSEGVGGDGALRLSVDDDGLQFINQWIRRLSVKGFGLSVVDGDKAGGADGTAGAGDGLNGEGVEFEAGLDGMGAANVREGVTLEGTVGYVVNNDVLDTVAGGWGDGEGHGVSIIGDDGAGGVDAASGSGGGSDGEGFFLESSGERVVRVNACERVGWDGSHGCTVHYYVLDDGGWIRVDGDCQVIPLIDCGCACGIDCASGTG